MSAVTTLPQSSARRSRLDEGASGAAPLARPQGHWSPLVIRLALAGDEQRLRGLAGLDSARPLTGQKLLAEQDGAIVAAVSLSDDRAIADPFRSTAVTLALLRLRAEELSAGGVGLAA